MFCCISNQTPTEPVVAKTSGCLFERRLIEKYISEHGRCPKTGEPLRVEDLITVAAGTPVPRVTPSQATIPGLLQSLHHEWDAMMLEQFTLRQQLAQTQQELSHALFQHDAACRVIAKLMQERDALRKQLGDTSSSKAKDETAGAAEDEQEEDAPALPLVVCEAIDEHERRLRQQRKHRDPPRTLAATETVKQFVEFDSHTAHGNQAVTALDVVDVAGGRSVVSGGADGKIMRYDVARRAVCGVGVGHRKAVRAVKDLGDVVVSCSDDATVRVWRSEGDTLSNSVVLKVHQAPVNGLCVLPGEQFVVSVDDSGRFVLSDMVKGFMVAGADSEHTRLGNTCVAMHPDGSVAATASAGCVLLWDIKMMEVHVKLTPPGRNGAVVTSIAFNEDGTTFAASTNAGTVAFWDLKKVSEPICVLPMSGSTSAPKSIQRIAFDNYGSYLSVASDDLRLWDWNRRSELVTLSSHVGPITDVAWGSDAKWIASSSLDKTVRLYGAINV